MKINDLSRKIELFVIVVIIATIGIVFAFKQQPSQAPTTEKAQVTQNDDQKSQQVPTSIITYQGQDGKNAIELLKATHSVDLKSYSFGDMVVGIDGIQPDQNHFWAFYVNDQLSQVGASAYASKSTDTIKWQIDEVKSFNQ